MWVWRPDRPGGPPDCSVVLRPRLQSWKPLSSASSPQPAPSHHAPSCSPTWERGSILARVPRGTRSTVGERRGTWQGGCPRERRLAVSPGETLPQHPGTDERIGVSKRLLSQVRQCLSCWALIGQVGTRAPSEPVPL